MKIPSFHFTAPASAEPSRLSPRFICGQYTGVYVSDMYPLALKFVESCAKIETYDGAFEVCNMTRQEGVPKYSYYQVNNWESNSQTLYANATVPQPLLDCLNQEIPRAISSNNHNAGILIAGVLTGAVLLGAAACVCVIGKNRKHSTRYRDERPQAQVLPNFWLGGDWGVFLGPSRDVGAGAPRQAAFSEGAA